MVASGFGATYLSAQQGTLLGADYGADHGLSSCVTLRCITAHCVTG